jgi:hypothetical protein
MALIVVVGNLVPGAGETGVAPVHEEDLTRLGVAAERVDGFATLCVVQGPVIHRALLSSY